MLLAKNKFNQFIVGSSGCNEIVKTDLVILLILEVKYTNICALWEGGPSAKPAPSHNLEALRGCSVDG